MLCVLIQCFRNSNVFSLVIKEWASFLSRILILNACREIMYVFMRLYLWYDILQIESDESDLKHKQIYVIHVTVNLMKFLKRKGVESNMMILKHSSPIKLGSSISFRKSMVFKSLGMSFCGSCCVQSYRSNYRHLLYFTQIYSVLLHCHKKWWNSLRSQLVVFYTKVEVYRIMWRMREWVFVKAKSLEEKWNRFNTAVIFKICHRARFY